MRVEERRWYGSGPGRDGRQRRGVNGESANGLARPQDGKAKQKGKIVTCSVSMRRRREKSSPLVFLKSPTLKRKFKDPIS